MAHRPAATLSNVKGKRDAPSLPANVTCLHSTQTNRSEPTMCVSGMPGAQSCKCSCEVTFSQPKHSFVIMVATPFWNSGEVPGDCAWWRKDDEDYGSNMIRTEKTDASLHAAAVARWDEGRRFPSPRATKDPKIKNIDPSCG